MSTIREQYAGLAKNNYDGIIGLRDLRPQYQVADIPRLLDRTGRGLYFRMPSNPITVDIILAVMEVEAWFLAEYSHFLYIDPSLTPTRIKSEIGFDPSSENMEDRQNPAQDLHSIYRLVGLAYSKSKNHTERTVEALDYARIYLELQHIVQLRELIDAIEGALFGTEFLG